MKDPCEPDQGNRELTTRVLRATANLKEVGTTKHYAEEHEVHTRHAVGVRMQVSSKPKTDTERQYVDATAMSVKEVRVYPGRSRPTHESATQKKRRSEKSADTIVEASTALKGETK
jgi:hypothetical protein